MEQLRPDVEKTMREVERTLTGTPEERKQGIQKALREILTKVACEAVGEKGRELVQKMVGE
jgi:hypothetical protein